MRKSGLFIIAHGTAGSLMRPSVRTGSIISVLVASVFGLLVDKKGVEPKVK